MGRVDVNETGEKQSGILVGLYFRCIISVGVNGNGKIWKINNCWKLISIAKAAYTC